MQSLLLILILGLALMVLAASLLRVWRAANGDGDCVGCSGCLRKIDCQGFENSKKS